MIYREAQVSDIPQIMVVRLAVKENVLSNPALVTNEDCEEYITIRGNGWVCEVDGVVVGFAIADLVDHNVWALFVDPESAGKGIGKQLHQMMLDWYFDQTGEPIWLGTGFDTKAETFYRMQGWREIGLHGKKETKFEMTANDWLSRREE
jgi:GNAT superfamily N-acetyltransferase